MVWYREIVDYYLNILQEFAAFGAGFLTTFCLGYIILKGNK